MSGIAPPRRPPPPQPPRRPAHPAATRAPERPYPPAPSKPPVASPPPAQELQPPFADRTRSLGFAPTGFYQQTVTGASKPVTLQINVAGRAIVGWFGLPPGKEFNVDFGSWPANPRPELRSGAFVVDARAPRGGGGYTMYWWLDTTAGPGNQCDPHTSLISAAGAHRKGIFAWSSGRGGTAVVRFDPSASTPDTFVRYAHTVRLPWSTLQQAPAELRNTLIAEQLRPIAPSWVEQMLDTLTGPTAKARLANWHESSSSAFTLPGVKKGLRGDIARCIQLPELEPGRLSLEHQTTIRSQLAAVLKNSSPRLGGNNDSWWHWYEVLAADDAADRVATPVYERLGISTGAADGYAYILDFIPVTPSITQNQKIADAARRTPLGGDVTAFGLAVRRVRVRFKTDKGVRQVDPDGNPVLENPKLLEDAQQESERGVFGLPPSAPRLSTRVDGPGQYLIGLFASLGVGVGYEVKVDWKASASAELKAAGAPSLGQATFFSSRALKAEDFNLASYLVVSFEGPAAGGNAGPRTETLVDTSTTLHEIRLRSTEVLDSVSTARKVIDGKLTRPTVRDVTGGKKSLTDYFKTLVKATGKLRAFGIGLGGGIIVSIGATSPQPTQLEPVQSQPLLSADPAAGVVLFQLNKADLVANPNDPFIDARFLLEAFLAANRVACLSPATRIEVSGYTSPEGTDQDNLKLSRARANTVAQAFEEAWGGRRLVPQGNRHGYGEVPAWVALKGRDPPDDPVGRAKFERENPDDVQLWPRWRKVEISIADEVIVRGLDSKP